MNQLLKDGYFSRKILGVHIFWLDGQEGTILDVRSWQCDSSSDSDTYKLTLNCSDYTESYDVDNRRVIALELLTKHIENEQSAWWKCGACGSQKEKDKLWSEVKNYLVRLRALDQEDYYKEMVYKW